MARQIAGERASTNPSIRPEPGATLTSVPDFADAVDEFTKFIVNQGYPPTLLLWVKPGDVVRLPWYETWSNFVWKGDLRIPSHENHDSELKKIIVPRWSRWWIPS